jgi:GNAT superfamily N-acetyltransferase
MKEERVQIRQLTEDDILSVLAVQREAYLPQLIEAAETFLNKLRLFPQGAIGYFVDGRLCAYIFSHPWIKDQVVPINHPISCLPPKPDCLYIHDLAVSPKYQAKGFGRRLLERVFKLGDSLGIRWYSLIAVQSSEQFWLKFGFQPTGTIQYVKSVQGTIMVLERVA